MKKTEEKETKKEKKTTTKKTTKKQQEAPEEIKLLETKPVEEKTSKELEEELEEKIVEENIAKAEKLLEEEQKAKEKESDQEEVVEESVEEIEEVKEESPIEEKEVINEENEEIEVTKEVIEKATKTITKNAKKEIRKEKTKKFFDNLFAFIILVLIIGGITAGVYYWYTKVYDPNKKYEINLEEKEETPEEISLSPFVYTAEGTLGIINNKYIIDSQERESKILDLKGNEIIKIDDQVFVEEGIDEKLYAYKIEDAETESRITLYEIKDNKLNELLELNESSVFFSAIMYQEGENEYLVGFGGIGGSEFEGYNTVIYTLDGKLNKLEDTRIIGDIEPLGIGEDYYTNSKKGIVVKNKQNKSGVYDFESQKMVIDFDYTDLYSINDTDYVAIKDERSGIINTNLKKILDFEYIFIDRNDEFFVLNKNNKLAIMDKKYNMITKFEFDYQGEEYDYNLCCGRYNSFIAFKQGDKYVLNTSYDPSLDYNKYETYIIDNNGEYKTLVDVELVKYQTNNLVYTYNPNTKIYTIYDNNMEEKFKIDIKQFDIKTSYPYISYYNPNTLKVEGYKIYFDAETGENIKTPNEYEYTKDNLSIKYLSNKTKVEIKIDDKLEGTDNEYGKLIEINNKIIYLGEKILVSYK